LFGGQSISTKVALFPMPDYNGKIVADLFGDEAYFADAGAFWDLQNKAIAAKRDAYLASSWSEVVILEPGERFHTWEHEKTAKKKGGQVFVAVSQRGEVQFFEGYLSAKEARRTRRTDSAEEGEAVAAERAEVSSALQNYIDLHRHAAARSALLDAPQVALRLMIAQAICGSPLWQVKSEPQAAKSKAIADSIAASPAQDEFVRRRAEFVTLLGLDDERPMLVQASDDVMAVTVFAALLKLPNADVMRVLAMLAAETLAAGTGLVEAVGAHLKVDTAKTWTPEDAFFELIREKRVVNAMLAEVAGKAVADGNVAERLRTQKQIARDCFEGANDRPKMAGWLPCWMSFPARGYTDRGGLSHVDAWREIAHLFPQP
jgi:ParB family chromosome partitioning protein